jgi:Fur family ferric uptake transcriptional regulator/Fur family zinc uptake transcriptional regulator
LKDKKNIEKQVLALLRSSGLRVTRQREEILRFLIEKGRPLSHAEVQDAIPELDRVTLYRTLTCFVEKEVAHQVQGPDGAWRFCAHPPKQDACPGNHPHFLCSACGKMTCLTDQKLARVELPEGYEVEGKQFVVYGKCSGCSS